MARCERIAVKKGTKDSNQTKHEVTRFGLFIFSPPPSFPPSDTLSLPLPLSPARSAWLILMGRPLFVNVPSCVHRCRLSIIAGLWGSFSIWRHIWHSAASINVVIILIFMSLGFTPFPLLSTPSPMPVADTLILQTVSLRFLKPFDNLASEQETKSFPCQIHKASTISSECHSKTLNATLFPLYCGRRVTLLPMCQNLCIVSEAQRLRSMKYERA